MNLGEVVTVDAIKKADATTPIPVASTGTIYTPSFPLAGVESIEFLAASDGAVNVLVQLQVSSDRPTTEEATDTDWAVPDGLADIINLTDETVHTKQIDAPRVKYGRLKLIGQGSNAASTTVRINLNRREYP